MAVPQRNSLSSERVSTVAGRDTEVGSAFQRTDNQDETLVLSTLKGLVAAGEHRLDPMLAAIADAALLLTGASGVGLAMWKDGAMVCRARSGKTAPVLGTRLSDTGISGECLRTGKSQHCCDTENNPLVDAEVCRALGLRSIVALPIQGWRGVNGILEAFSTAPAAFAEHHLKVLEQLAALAERARALQPHGASPVVIEPRVEQLKPQATLPACDRVSDAARVFAGRRSRALVLSALGLAAILLFSFVTWRGWRGHDRNDGEAQVAAPSPATAAAIARLAGDTQLRDAHPQDQHLPDNDFASKPNAGGRSLPTADAARVVLPQRAAGSVTKADHNSSGASHGEEGVGTGPPPVAVEQDPSALNGVLSAKAVLPKLSAPVSQGVSGGQLLHRVPPVYPAQAKMERIEGKVILDAMVMEDGRLRDLKVVQGQPVLAQSAVEAVMQWRYQPFMLDGKPVKRETRITVEFKLP